MVDAGIIGVLALIATSGTPALPMRSTTTLIDETGTCARASAAMTVGGSGPAGTATRWKLFFLAAFSALVVLTALLVALLAVCFCDSAFVPPPLRATAGKLRLAPSADTTTASAVTARQRLAKGVFEFFDSALYMCSDRVLLRFAKCGYCSGARVYDC